jgi:hypothetical protein
VNSSIKKSYYIGLALASNSASDSGVVVLDGDNNLILVDKLYKMDDVIHFFDNYSSRNQSEICISLPWDKTMLEGKWRILGKPYQMVATNTNMPNQANWTQRYAARGSDYFSRLIENGANISRFELYLTRQSMNLNSFYKERSPADCKFLQQILRTEWDIDLPANMMPMSQLEAIVGALLAKEKAKNPSNIKTLFQFKNVDVIDVKQNPNNAL